MDAPSVLPYRRAALGDRPDDCYRCGYPLLGIDDEQPCPECGLLARRSRRTTDELHNTRPRWLARISRGANLVLVAMVIAGAWLLVWNVTPTRYLWFGRPYGYLIPVLGYWIAAIILAAGTWLLTSPEQYPPADSADRRLRAFLRGWGFAPLFALLVQMVRYAAIERAGIIVMWRRPLLWEAFTALVGILFTAGLAPLPLLLFARLRSLAKRARSAHLAEHCTIVGIGMSAVFLWGGLLALLSYNARRWGFGSWWMERSTIALAVMLVMSVAVVLFTLWSLYLFTRFAIAFHRAARQLRGQWTADDRSRAPPAPPTIAGR